MYEVYTAQRPGRAGKSIAATAILLLLTVAAAEALILYRERAVSVQLGPINHYPEGQLSVRLPAGWTALENSDRPSGAVVGLEDAEAESRQRRLFVLRGVPRVYDVPSSGDLRRPGVVLDLARPLGAAALLGEPLLEPLGGLPGVTALAIPDPRAVEMVEMPLCLTRAAIGPGGEAVGVILQTDARPTATDRKLLEEVCASIVLDGFSLDIDPGKAMKAAGISFDPPADTRFIGPADPDVPRLRMMGGSGPDAWYLDAYRVPLVGRRSVAALVEDQGTSAALTVRLPQPVETFEANGRSAARTNVAFSGRDATLHILGVQTDPHTAVLLLGRHEPAAADSLRKLCEEIAARAKVESYDGLIDLSTAVDTGRRLIRDTREQGLSTFLQGREGKDLRFRAKAPALNLGEWTEGCRRVSGDGKTSWELTSEGGLRLPGMSRPVIVVEEKWQLAENGVEYTYEHRRTRMGEPVMGQREQCRPDGRQVLRAVETNSGARRDTIAVDDTFASGPLAMQVAARVARDSNARVAIVSQIDSFTAGTTYQVIKPLGKTAPPGSVLKDPAWTVRVTADYDPRPVLLYFDEQGDLLASSSDGQEWRERVEEPIEADEPSGPAKRSKR